MTSPSLATYGPWALVTGASSGLGLELARLLAAKGFHLLLVARNSTALSALATDLTKQHGPDRSFITHPADLTSTDEIDKLIAATSTLDIGLVVTAAGFGTSGDFLSADPKDELAMLHVNCRAPLLLAHHGCCVSCEACKHACSEGAEGHHSCAGDTEPVVKGGTG